jgi:hypothetical protein
METTSGGNCRTSINCRQSDNAYEKLPDWNVCYLGGRQFFSRPEVGDCKLFDQPSLALAKGAQLISLFLLVSITFTKAGGKDGNKQDGLHHPVLQFANLNNWENMDVQAILDNSKEKHGNLCKQTRVAGTQQLTWECGIPKVGTAAFGLSIFKPVDPAPGFKAVS